MNFQDQTHPNLVAAHPTPQQPRVAKDRMWLRNRTGRIVIPVAAFLLGIVLALLAIVSYALTISGHGQILSATPPPQSSAIMVQIGPAYITHLVDKSLHASGLVNASNIQVTLQRGARITINGDEPIIFGITRHFTVLVQPYIASCRLKIHVLQADLGGIPITGFVANFEDQINQQLLNKPINLPSGFAYCESSVRTDSQGLYLTISAKPV